MKKLVMFVMVFCIAGSALGRILDADIPPDWGNAGTSTGVWDFAIDPHDNRPADCLDPDLGEILPDRSGSWFDGLADKSTWANGVFSGAIQAVIGVPLGGDYVTIRMQLFLVEGSTAPPFGQFETQMFTAMPPDDNDEAESYTIWPEPWEGHQTTEKIGNVVINQMTVARDDWPDFVAVGGYIPATGQEWGVGGEYIGLIIDTIVHDTPEPPESGPRVIACLQPAITIDYIDMPVYEPQDVGGPSVFGPTDGQLLVSLAWQPGDPTYPATFTATVTVDPNTEGNRSHEDFTFVGGDGSTGNVTLTFNETNWWDPQNVVVEAVADLDREGNELYPVELTVTINIADPNFGNPTPVVVGAYVSVVDNDIPYVSALPDPIELSENDPCVCVDLKVRLSHKPTDDVYVKVYKDGGAFNPPEVAYLEPSLEPDGPDPNKLTFTTVDDAAFDPCTMTSGWNVEQTITVCPIDNDELAEAWVEYIDGRISLPSYSEDVRYLVPRFNPDGSAAVDSGGEADETGVLVEVQDNECGAVGFAPGDFNGDCTVGLADIALLYKQWLICTNPYEAGCDKLWMQ